MTTPDTARFEGSFLGNQDRISAAAVMECKICWSAYDPAVGDDTRQIPPGTPFLALPGDWKCPTCDGAKDQFMVLSDERGDDAAATLALGRIMNEKVAALVAEFREIHSATMRNGPFSNEAISVEAVGFRAWEGHWLGVLITPWFMNLMLLPGPNDRWSAIQTGTKELVAFPSGLYEFINVQRAGAGAYKACSLFSPMGEFASQLQATDVARAVMMALFDEGNREETDHSYTVRQMREAEIAAAAAKADRAAAAEAGQQPTRRTLFTGQHAASTGEAGGRAS